VKFSYHFPDTSQSQYSLIDPGGMGWYTELVLVYSSCWWPREHQFGTLPHGR